MTKKINSNFSLALIISIILHIGLIAVLGYSAWQYLSPFSNVVKGESIEAIMVDNRIMTEQYQRQLQHQVASQQIKQQQQQQIEDQAKELQEKQLAEQQRLKELEKARLLALDKQKQEQEAISKALAEKQRIENESAKAKAQLEAQQKQALLAKQKADEEAKRRAQKELLEKQRIEVERKQAELEKQKALVEAERAKQEAEQQKAILQQERLKVEKEQQEKLKAKQEAQRKALEERQRQQTLEDILGGLTSNEPASQPSVSSAELSLFKSQVTDAISNKFINPQVYNGKNCVLEILLAPDGSLVKVSAKEGDTTLCREAISATSLAVFPKPKSPAIYQQIKNLTIDFRPK